MVSRVRHIVVLQRVAITLNVDRMEARHVTWVRASILLQQYYHYLMGILNS